MVAITEAEAVARGETTLEGQLRVAMDTTKDHWLITDDYGRFQAAVGAVLLLSGDKDKERIIKEMRHLRIFSAMISGVPVDFAGVEKLENPIGLMKMWRGVKIETPY
jgi:hypothetical protein